jgi:hypothetical protein
MIGPTIPLIAIGSHVPIGNQIARVSEGTGTPQQQINM